MKLIRLACAAGVVLVSGGCAGNLTAPRSVSEHSVVRVPSTVTLVRLDPARPAGETRIYFGGEHWGPPAYPNPLYVVDGVRFSREAFLKERVKPQQIEKITIVTGPSALRSFGNEAVVVIRTRRK